jgi:phospholipid transport system substrate-binding protein
MKRILTRKRWAPMIAIIWLYMAVPVTAGVPGDEMRATIENVLATLQDPNLKGPEKQGERRNKLRDAIYPRFDFAEMAKRSLGPHWQRRSPEEQKKFVEVFTALVEGAYLDAIESYNGEKVVVASDKQDKTFADVNSKIVTKKGEEFAIEYKLHQAEGGWKVYDVVLENISLVNNYRSQFNRVISKSSYEGLLSKMLEKKFEAPGKKQKT